MASSKRERELARMRAERQAARRTAAEARRKRQRATALGVVAALVVAGVAIAAVLASSGSSKKKTVDAITPPTSSAAPVAAGTGKGSCSYRPSGKTARALPAGPVSKGVDTVTPYRAALTLNTGLVEFTLDTAKAPCTVNSFKFLSDSGFYNGTPCPRLVNTSGLFVLQCGDPSGTTSGGPGYQYGDENLTGATYPAGTVAMANSGPNTNGSQFFLVFKASQLGPQYTPFGRITKGLDVLAKIAAAGDDGKNPAGGGKPNKAVTITKAVVTKAA